MPISIYMKKLSHKTSPYTFLIVAMGPGEIGQGMAFARYAMTRGVFILFGILRKDNSPFVAYKEKRFKYFLFRTSNELKKALKQYRPNLLVLCNSKLFNWDGTFILFPPRPKPPTLSIDSNWLFHPKSPYSPLPWVDRYCINIPQKVFRYGLKKYGGRYVISKEYLKRIRVVGLLPSYTKISKAQKRHIRKKYGIKKDEKLIFLYTSVGGLLKPVVFEKAIAALEILRAKNRFVKMIYVGEKKAAAYYRLPKGRLIITGRKSTDEFYSILSSSDLVFQHQGLGTLSQAISAEVPVIANVKDLKDESSPYHSHAWEIIPFKRCGACSLFYFRDPVEKIVREIEALLYSSKRKKRMKQDQHLLYSRGEEKVFNEAMRLVKTSDHS